MGLESSQALNVIAPYSGRVFSRALAATSQRYAVPNDWRNAYVTIAARGGRAWILFGTSSVTASATQDSTLATEALTAHAQTAIPIEDGSREHFRVSDETHFAVIAESAAGRWVAWRSSPSGG